MKYRTVSIHDRESYTSDGVKVINIDVNDPISSLVIGLEATLGSATMAGYLQDNLTKIELVDGGKVLWSTDCKRAEAIDWYNLGGKVRSNHNIMLNGNTPYRAIGLNFGRWLWDEVYALDPKQFRNLQLRLTLDIDAVDGAAATDYLEVFANVFDEKAVSPVGFIATMDVKSWTAAASTHEYTDLPLDYPLRALYVQALLAGTEPNQAISNIKVSEDQDKKVPIDLGAQEITRTLLAKYGPVEEHYYFATGTSNKYLYIMPTTRVAGFLAQWATSASNHVAALYDGDGGRLKTISATAGHNSQIYVRGHIPHAVYEVPFGDPMVPEDALDPRSLGSLKLDVTGASTPACVATVQQYRNY